MASSLAESMQKLSMIEFDVGSDHSVNMIHITDPGNFYVLPTAYREYLPRLNQHNGPADLAKLRLGSTVVFNSKTKQHTVRGQIRNITTQNETVLYDLFALDYGFTEQAVIEDLKEPLDDCPVPALAVHCELADCQPRHNNVFDDDAIDAMIFYVGQERAKMIVQGKTGDKYIVRLINSCPEDIATMLALFHYTCLGYENNAVSRVPKLYYDYKKVKVGDTLHVRIQSGDSLESFYVCEIDDYKKYIRYEKSYSYNFSVSIFGQEHAFRAENLKCGNVVAVYYNLFSRYERAIIKEVMIPERKAKVQLVDLGIKCDVDIDSSELREMSKEDYFLRPAMAIFCTADDKQLWFNGFHRFLYPGREFVITVKKIGNQLDTPNVVHISKLQ